MRVLIQGHSQNLLYHTVRIAKDPTNPDNVEMIRCFRCGEAICQIQGQVVDIFPGMVPTNDIAVIYKCHNRYCKEMYRITTGEYTPQTKVVLSVPFGSPMGRFHCLYCADELLQYTALEARLMPYYDDFPLPKSVTCRLCTKPHTYDIQSIVVY